jgi:NitT/TauT family transport system substrate-binding protein
MFITRRVFLILLILVLTHTVASSQPIRASYVGTTGTNAPLWVTHEVGLFKKYGLNTELILISGGSTILQALLANEVSFVNIGGPPIIQARLQGADVLIIASPYSVMPYSLVVHSAIRSPEDLKGKRLAIARLGGITEVAARLAIEKLGLGPKDLTLAQSGPDAQRIAAVQSGAAAATVIGPPAVFAAVSLGLRAMLDLSDFGIKYPMGLIATTRAFHVQHRANVKKFIMAFVEGLHFYSENKDFSIKVMRKYTRLDNEESLSKSYDYFVKKTTLIPLTDPNVLKEVLPVERAPRRNVEDFFDNSVLQELVSEGFVAKLERKRR